MTKKISLYKIFSTAVLSFLVYIFLVLSTLGNDATADGYVIIVRNDCKRLGSPSQDPAGWLPPE